MYEYYRRQPNLPTFAGFDDESAFAAYQALRASVLRDRLTVPAALFRGAEVLEFGPDSGENAVVFARWGARLTLVEPNSNAHAAIRAYFERFADPAALRGIAAADVLGYTDTRRYDIVVAEGFIYTVKPNRAWLDAFRRLLLDDGLFIVSYIERFGGTIELAGQALYRIFRRGLDLDAITAARRLYGAKWETIAHTRRFESWVMDVLENPFVRLATFISAEELIDDALAAGFDLYATYPHYDDALCVEWHKRVRSPAERAERSKPHVRASVLSFLTGRTLFVGDPQRASALAVRAERLIALVDRLIDVDDAAAAREIADTFADFAAVAGDPAVVAGGGDARSDAAATLAALAAAFDCVARNDLAALERHTTSDRAFLSAWGTPTHFAVGRALAPPV